MLAVALEEVCCAVGCSAFEKVATTVENWDLGGRNWDLRFEASRCSMNESRLCLLRIKVLIVWNGKLSLCD